MASPTRVGDSTEGAVEVELAALGAVAAPEHASDHEQATRGEEGHEEEDDAEDRHEHVRIRRRFRAAAAGSPFVDFGPAGCRRSCQVCPGVAFLRHSGAFAQL